MYQIIFIIILGILLLGVAFIAYKTRQKSERFMKAFYVKPDKKYWTEKYELLQPSNFYNSNATGSTLLTPISLTGYDPTLMKMCTDLIYRGYDYFFTTPGAASKDADKVYDFLNYEKLYNTDNGETLIIIQKDINYRRIWIINRGVSSKEELIELLTNFYTNDMMITKSPTPSKIKLTTMIDVLEGETQSNFEGVQSKAIEVFNKASINVINKLTNEIDITDKDQIIVTGHSFGGAVSLLIYKKLLETYRNIMVCYTFNSIKVGNKIFKKNIPAERVFRIFNTEDIVPSLPFASFYNWNTDTYENYYHVGQNYAFCDNSGSGSFNHSMDIIKLNQNSPMYIQENTMI